MCCRCCRLCRHLCHPDAKVQGRQKHCPAHGRAPAASECCHQLPGSCLLTTERRCLHHCCSVLLPAAAAWTGSTHLLSYSLAVHIGLHTPPQQRYSCL